MLFTSLPIGEKEYKLKLTTHAVVELERKLKTNPVNVLMRMAATNEFPSLETVMTIFHASLQAYNHGISVEEAYEIYDAYLETGKNMADLIYVLVQVFQNSGLIPKVEDEGKNA